tara:strand:- start:1593 stop:1778 length:186 start_codon:yes stop_codon:yes gene_type:complete
MIPLILIATISGWSCTVFLSLKLSYDRVKYKHSKNIIKSFIQISQESDTIIEDILSRQQQH